MKKTVNLALILLGVIVCLLSCQKAPELMISSPASIELSVDGSNGSITFTANRDWRASSSDSWVTVSPSLGEASDKPVTVSVRCYANTTYDDRTATVTIRMEDLSKSVTVRQPANLGFVLPKQVFDLQSDASSIDVEVQANVQYSVSTSVDWIKQTSTKALTSKTLTFSIEENKTYDPREGKIIIKPQEGNAQEQVISVKQAQKDALNVEKTSYDMPYGGGEIEIKVESNVSFDVTPNVDWIHFIQTKALSSSTVSLKNDENVTFSSRQGTVEIKQKNGSLKHTISVNQAGRIAVTSVELDKTSLSLRPDETATLIATVKPDNATDKTVTWTTSDSEIATVDASGKVTAIKDGTVTITAKSGDITALCAIVVENTVVPEGAVDLGIVMTREDGSTYRLFWAKCNVGASSPEEYGDYYAWGETEPKETYSWDTYKWCNGYENKLTKYCTPYMAAYWDGIGSPDGKNVLDPEDDVAHVKIGGKWRMPTNAEWAELLVNCTWTWTQKNNVRGIKIIGKNNSNSIFLPASDGRCIYWSSSLFSTSLVSGEPYYAWGIVYFDNINGLHRHAFRCLGFLIRPVTE